MPGAGLPVAAVLRRRCSSALAPWGLACTATHPRLELASTSHICTAILLPPPDPVPSLLGSSATPPTHPDACSQHAGCHGGQELSGRVLRLVRRRGHHQPSRRHQDPPGAAGRAGTRRGARVPRSAARWACRARWRQGRPKLGHNKARAGAAAVALCCPPDTGFPPPSRRAPFPGRMRPCCLPHRVGLCRPQAWSKWCSRRARGCCSAA